MQDLCTVVRRQNCDGECGPFFHCSLTDHTPYRYGTLIDASFMMFPVLVQFASVPVFFSSI